MRCLNVTELCAYRNKIQCQVFTVSVCSFLVTCLLRCPLTLVPVHGLCHTDGKLTKTDDVLKQ